MPLGSSIGSVVGGLISSGRKLPTIDMRELLATIRGNKEANAQMINMLPEQLRPKYAEYIKSLTGAGETLRGDTSRIGQNLLERTQGLYGPDSEAVKATLAGLKQQTYSTLPGTLDALRANLAATGGLARGGASRAITQAVLAPAAQFSQQSANVMGQQLQLQQQNVQSALNTIARLDDQTSQSLFGMSKEQASNILQFGRDDLKEQLSSLINNNNAATQATLGAQGISANQAYQNAVTRNAQQEAITRGLVDVGVQGASSMFGGGADAGGGLDYATLAAQGQASTPPGGVMQYRPNNSMFALT